MYKSDTTSTVFASSPHDGVMEGSHRATGVTPFSARPEISLNTTIVIKSILELGGKV